MADEQSMNHIERELANAQEGQPKDDGKGTNEYAQIASIISDLDRRLRVLEERYSNLRKKLQLTDQNMIESERGYAKELRSFNDELL